MPIDLSSFKGECLQVLADKYPDTSKDKVPGDEVVDRDVAGAVLDKVDGEIQAALPGLNALTPTQSKSVVDLVATLIHHNNLKFNEAARVKAKPDPKSPPAEKPAPDKPPTPPVEGRHAPKGGITVAGVQYADNAFVPDDVFAKATPAEKASLVPAAKP